MPVSASLCFCFLFFLDNEIPCNDDLNNCVYSVKSIAKTKKNLDWFKKPNQLRKNLHYHVSLKQRARITSDAIWQIQEKAEELKAVMVLKSPAILKQGLEKNRYQNVYIEQNIYRKKKTPPSHY